MKQRFSAAILLIGLTALVGFTGCNNPAPTNENVAVATPEPTPDKAAIQTELTRIENDWPRIIKERDGATARKIEADDVVIIYPDGSLGTKDLDAKAIEEGHFTFDSWDVLEVKVNVIDKDLAVVTYRYQVKNGMIKDGGRSLNVSGQYLSLDTFKRRNGQWQFVALSSAQVKEPVAATSLTPSTSPAVPAPSAVRANPTPRVSPVPRITPAARPSTPRPTPARATPAQTP